MVALGRRRREKRSKGGWQLDGRATLLVLCADTVPLLHPPRPPSRRTDDAAKYPPSTGKKEEGGNTFFFWSALATVQYEQSPVASPSFSFSPLDGAIGRSWGGGWPQQRDGPPDSPHRWRTLSAAVLQLTGQIGVRVRVLLLLLLLLLLHPHISRMHAGMTTWDGGTAAGHGIREGGGQMCWMHAPFFTLYT